MTAVRHSEMRLHLVGSLGIRDHSGQDLTPKGARARAVLALVAMSPQHKASRRWLEAMIWPDRDDRQASGSLRQVLSGIRRGLGGNADALGADRLDVWLPPDRWQIDIRDRRPDVLGKLIAGRELLEGLYIASEEFEDWLRQERATLQAEAEATLARRPPTEPVGHIRHPTAGPPPILYGDKPEASTVLEEYFVDVIRTQLAQTASAFSRAEVRFLDGIATPTLLAPGARCTVRVTEHGPACHVVARMTQEPDGRIVWMRRQEFDSADADAIQDCAASLALEGTEAFSHMAIAASGAQHANTLACQAFEDIFSFDPTRLAAAIDLLEQANDLDPHAPRPALQALATAFLALETEGTAEGEVGRSVQPMVDRAMALDSANPLALSFLADVYDLVFGDTQTALGLARCALRSNPGIGYAYSSLGAFELRRGKLKEARAAALRGQRQLANTSLEVFSLMRLCVTSMNTGDIADATGAAERAAELAPFSCPPLRHLYALRLSEGDHDGARQALLALRRLEPEFSMRRLRDDPSFPAPSLRRMGFDLLQDVEL